MKLGVIADDFTGASDIALTLAEGGFRVAQFVGVPPASALADIDAGVVSLKSRTAPMEDAVRDSLRACDWLVAQGAEQIVFKICSTFDSTCDGNIGPVLDALSAHLEIDAVAVCPAFPETGRSVYQGHLFVGDTLLSDSSMRDHPLTPMTKSDLRRVLAEQSNRPVGHIGYNAVAQGHEAIASALSGRRHLIVDAITDDDLHAIGRAVRGARLLCGGSGIALGLPANFGQTTGQPIWAPVSGRGVVLAGSCSRATLAQVDTFKQRAPAYELVAADVISGRTTAEDLAGWVMTADDDAMIYSSANPEAVETAQAKFGINQVAAALEAFFADLAGRLADAGVTRIVVAGGETSGAVVLGLHAKHLGVGPRIAPGVPLLRIERERPIALALKSGNFGGPKFFAEALDRMECA